MGTEQYILTEADFKKLKQLREHAGFVARHIEFKERHPGHDKALDYDELKPYIIELIKMIHSL